MELVIADYHRGFVSDPDVLECLPKSALTNLRQAWGCHHDDYAPHQKKFGTAEFEGGNQATYQNLQKLRDQTLAHFQREMNALNIA